MAYLSNVDCDLAGSINRIRHLSYFAHTPDITITLDNGQQGVLDMSPFLAFGVFKKIRNKEQFKQVKVAFDTIEWSSGADLDPEFVYEKVVFDI